MTKTTTVKNLTETQIRKLRAEAAEADDFAMVAICDYALDGTLDCDDYTCLAPADVRRIDAMDRDGAYAAIVEAITDAEAQA